MDESTTRAEEWMTWDRIDSGPADAEWTVLLLPGGLCTARQYREVMAEPALAGVHLVAVTLPGHEEPALVADLIVRALQPGN